MSDLDIMNAAHDIAVANLWQMLERLHCCDCGFRPLARFLFVSLHFSNHCAKSVSCSFVSAGQYRQHRKKFLWWLFRIIF